jgi:hypothetical protein
MNPIADWQGTACLLRAGFRASMAGHVGAVLAGLGILHQGVEAAYLMGLAAWGYLVYLQVRVSLDAELFSWLANGGTTAEMDGFLGRAGLISGARERSVEDRCRGAVRLWKQLMVVLFVELVVVVIGLR